MVGGGGTDHFQVVSPRGSVVGGLRNLGKSEHIYQADEIVMSGSYDDVLDYFDRNLWTDGLPVVPPTLARIYSMLAHSTRNPGELIGVVGDESIEATVWNTAVNSVMAGCRPQDFPILLAIVEMMCADEFRIRDAGSTTSWEILVVLSGPDLFERGFNTETGVMRLGCRANSSIGRFTRLWLRNVVGLLTPPGYTDMAAIGQSFYVAMAENDEATRDIGWTTCREEWGYERTDLVVAVHGVVAVSAPLYTAGGDPESHLRLLAESIAGCSGHFSGNGAYWAAWSPVLAMGPAIAELLARNGMSKEDVRQEIAGRSLVPARWLVEGALALGRSELDLAARVRRGSLPPKFHESDDPDRPVPSIFDPSRLAIVVTGNPGRNQSKYYIPLGLPGQRLTRRVNVD